MDSPLGDTVHSIHDSSNASNESKEVHRSKPDEWDIFCKDGYTAKNYDGRNTLAVVVEKKTIEWVVIRRDRVDKGDDDDDKLL